MKIAAYFGVLVPIFGYVDSTFTDNFSQFLTTFYNSTVEEQLARKDLGCGGSFGGGDADFVPGTKTKHRPVIFVNGLSTIALHYVGNRDYFLAHDYSNVELYATTYASGTVSLFTDSVICEHVKRERLLIEAVSNYTDSQVDVIGYSMGSPTARKAILGGNCVDTGEYVGAPITHLVHTFLGVAGANFGAEWLCHDVASHLLFKACNRLTGIVCNSTVLNDINSVSSYEGSVIYTMYSTDDEIVGYKTCNGKVLTSAIPKENLAVQYNVTDLKDHFGMLFLTINKQFDLISQGQL